MSIEVRGVTKKFGSFEVLTDVSLRVETGELVALLGPSGSGKTTLLRILGGLEVADAGSVFFDDEDATKRSARERQVGFVFQHYALFRNMSVFENVAFGLRVQPRKVRLSQAAIREKVHGLLQLVQLDRLGDRSPSQLSGGQRQRVALARALAVEPRVLLLDEPFGALDARVRRDLRVWLRRLHHEIGVTSVFVTHDQEEALELADRVVLMHEGKIEQIGTPEEVYEKPANPFVYHFLGRVNLFHGRVQEGRARIADGDLDLSEVPKEVTQGDTSAVAYVRPHDMDIERTQQSETIAAATVQSVRKVGALVRVELEREDTGDIVEAELTRERYAALVLAVGERVFLQPRKLRLFLTEDGQEKPDGSSTPPTQVPESGFPEVEVIKTPEPQRAS